MNIVAPRITLEDYESGRAKPIDVFEGQIKEWILNFAQYLAHEHQHSGIAVLLLASSALEPMGGVLPLSKGRKNSEAKFCSAFVRVFGTVPGAKDVWQVAERVCDLLRNGLFHEAFVKAGLVLAHQDAPIEERDGWLVIDPVQFIDRVAVAFTDVCNEIRRAEDTDPIKQAFNTYWNQKQNDHVTKLHSFIKPGTAYPSALSTSTSTLAPSYPSSWLKKL